MSQQGQPIVILGGGSGQTKGKDAQKNNITAAKLISTIVRTSLGPRGMDKMIVDSIGDVTITNDGATILKEIDVQHPAAKMMVEISKATDNEVGDGTTSSVVLAGALLEKAQELLDKDVHPTVIVDGYANAAEKAIEILNRIAIKVDTKDIKLLEKVAATSLASKLVSEDSKELSNIIVEAVLKVAEKDSNGKYKVDKSNIKIEKKAGGSIADTELIHGITLDKEVIHAGMPKRVTKVKIAMVNAPLEIEKTEMSAEIRIDDPAQMQKFLDEENNILKTMVDQIKSVGATLLVCQKGIDDVAQHYLSANKIMACRRIRESDMTKLAKATGGRVVANIEDLSKADLGYAELAEERKIEDDKWVFIEGAKNPKSVTILTRGGSQRIVDEAERSINDAVMVIKDVLEKPAIVAGGGSGESLAAHELLKWSEKLSGREQLAVQAFAEALESIPLALAENAGLDPIDIQVKLRNANSEGKKWIGVNVNSGSVSNLFEQNILEPLSVKEQVIKSANEASGLILRIDDVIASGKQEAGSGMPGGPMMTPGSMPMMGGM